MALLSNVQHLLEQATEAYLFGLFEAGAVVARAALEVALVGRWDAKHKGPAPGAQTGERLKLLKLEPLKLERQFPLVLASLRHRFFLAESLSARLVG